MNLQAALCREFCDGIVLAEVPAGLAVSTAFEDMSGDRIGFYLSRSTEGLYRIEDDGALVPTLIASGVNVTKGTRAGLFRSILSAGDVDYDTASGELRSRWLREEAVPAAAMRFVTVLMRVAGLTAVRPEHVSATFRDDAIARIKADLGDKFEIIEDGPPLAPELEDFDPDLLLIADDKQPVAVFVATSDGRLYEALLMHMATVHEARAACSVVALIDKEGSRLTTKKMRARARSRLPAAPDFYGEEGASVARLAMEADRLPARSDSRH